MELFGFGVCFCHSLRFGPPWLCLLFPDQKADVLPCPLWVKSRREGLVPRCPLYPRKRTSGEWLGMSAKCQEQTWMRLNRSPRRRGQSRSESGRRRPTREFCQAQNPQLRTAFQYGI